MQNVTKIFLPQHNLPIELHYLRVAVYYRVSTELEEQTSSIELRKQRYGQIISGNPNWEQML